MSVIRRFALLLAPVVLAGCQQASEPRVTGAWVRLAAAPGRPAGGYFTLAGGATDRTLTGVASPAAARIELHETMTVGGTMGGGMTGAMTMQPLAQVAVPAGGTLRFAPGGRHLMLFGVGGGVRAGQRVPLTFRFADGGVVRTEAQVIAAGDPPPTW